MEREQILKLIAEQGGNNKSKMNFIQRQLLQGTGKKKSSLRPENMTEAQIKAEIANIARQNDIKKLREQREK